MIDKRCTNCKYAEWTYDTYYGTRKKDWFVGECRLDRPVCECGCCEDWEEVEPYDPYDS